MADPGELLAVTGTWTATQISSAADTLQAAHAFLVQAGRDLLASVGVELSGTGINLLIGGTILFLFAGLARFRSTRAGRSKASSETLAALTRGPRRLGLAAAGAFAAVFAGWSVLAPLASAAIAPGVISADGNRKTIQHLEGGIIRSIHVREGDRVAVGEPLITLDDTRAKALDAEVRERLLHLLATEARLEAERTDAAAISFPELLLQESSTELQQVMEGQRQLLSTRLATHLGRKQVLEARIRQIDEQNSGLREVIAAKEEQLSLIDEEMDAAQELLDQGFERKPRVLALRRGRADVSGEIAFNRAKIAENEQAAGETRMQLLTMVEERQEKISLELADARRALGEMRGQLPSREDILQRTIIRAPIAGMVMDVRATTESGVVRPGDSLLEIVPDSSELIVDARVRPTDIERVRPGMTARVILTAYSQRSLPLIHGRLRSISADALTDERTGAPFFLAKIEVLPEDMARLTDVQLTPGMPAEVMLLDGENSLFEYLLSPILESGRRSFRED